MSTIERAVIAGEERVLGGCRPRLADVGALFAVWGDPGQQVAKIARNQWQPVSWRHKVVRIMDQDGVGACNAFASCQALETCRSIAGQRHVELSPGNLYGRINGGRDMGSALGDALQALRNEGVCTQSLVKPLDWHPRGWPDSWKTEAQQFRILEAFDCPTFDHIASAIQCGFLVDYGIMVGRNFDVESDGWVGEYRGGGGGHALCGVGLVERGGKWGILTANSWGEKWGDKGFGVVPESYFRGSFNDAWAVRAVTTESSDSEPTIS